MLEVKIRNQVSASFRSPSEAMSWIKEVEMFDSVDDFTSSHSVQGYSHFPNFEMLDARVASTLNKIIQNSYCKKKVSLEEQEAQKEDRFLRGRQIAYMICECFRVTGAHDTVLDFADFYSQQWCSGIRYEMGWNTTVDDQDPTWWSPGKFVLIENMWVWSTQNCIGIVRLGNSSGDIDARLSKIEHDGEEKQRSETQIAKLWYQKCDNWIRSSGYESQGSTWVLKEDKENTINGKQKGQCSRGDSRRFQHDGDKRAKPTPEVRSILWATGTKKMVEVHREERVSEAWVLGSLLDSRAGITWKVFARDHFVIIGILPNVNSIKLNRDANLVISVRFHTQRKNVAISGGSAALESSRSPFYPSQTIWHFSRKISSAETLWRDLIWLWRRCTGWFSDLGEGGHWDHSQASRCRCERSVSRFPPGASQKTWSIFSGMSI